LIADRLTNVPPFKISGRQHDEAEI